MVFYPGNMHRGNERELFSLYVGVHLLNKRGIPTKLVRSGLDFCDGLDVSLKTLKEQVAVELGFIGRAQVEHLIAAADVLVQPGAKGPFNDFRLPSKLPEFFSGGRPVLLPPTNIGLSVVDGFNAVLLDRGDGADIAEKAASLLLECTKADQLGAAGRAFATRFSWESGAQRLRKFYRERAGI
jgi:glycosyltransferase involved in cell wall biosynthesis